MDIGRMGDRLCKKKESKVGLVGDLKVCLQVIKLRLYMQLWALCKIFFALFFHKLCYTDFNVPFLKDNGPVCIFNDDLLQFWYFSSAILAFWSLFLLFFFFFLQILEYCVFVLHIGVCSSEKLYGYICFHFISSFKWYHLFFELMLFFGVHKERCMFWVILKETDLFVW